MSETQHSFAPRAASLPRRHSGSVAVAAGALAVVLLAVFAPAPPAPLGDPAAPRMIEDWRGNSASITPRAE